MADVAFWDTVFAGVLLLGAHWFRRPAWLHNLLLLATVWCVVEALLHDVMENAVATLWVICSGL